MSSPKPLPMIPGPSTRPNLTSPANQRGDASAWWAVRGGLRLIRWGLFLCALLLLAGFGHGVWIMFDQERALSDSPGLLKKADWPLWKEVLAAYSVGTLVPAAIFLLLGRMRCIAAPSESHAKALAGGAFFFTLVGLSGLTLFLGMTYFELGPKLKLPEQARLTALYAAIPSAVLADVFTLLFIGQIGWSIGRPSLQRNVAGFFAYAAILPAAVLIGMLYYPVIPEVQESLQITGSWLGDEDSNLAQKVLIWAVLIVMAAVMLFLRYAGVAGAARRGIRKMLEG